MDSAIWIAFRQESENTYGRKSVSILVRRTKMQLAALSCTFGSHNEFIWTCFVNLARKSLIGDRSSTTNSDLSDCSKEYD